jgi:hypothetical protein
VLVGAGEQDERALAIGEAALGPDRRPWPAIRGNLDVVLQALKERTSQRVYHGASRDIPALWRI